MAFVFDQAKDSFGVEGAIVGGLSIVKYRRWPFEFLFSRQSRLWSGIDCMNGSHRQQITNSFSKRQDSEVLSEEIFLRMRIFEILWHKDIFVFSVLLSVLPRCQYSFFQWVRSLFIEVFVDCGIGYCRGFQKWIDWWLYRYFCLGKLCDRDANPKPSCCDRLVYGNKTHESYNRWNAF